MQKTIRILAIIAAILVALSFLLLLISIPLQRTIGKTMSYNEELLSFLPIVPMEQFIRCLLMLLCTVLLAVFAGKNGVMLPEILLLAVLVLVIPFFSSFYSAAMTIARSQVGGGITIAAEGIVNTIARYCMIPAGLGNSLALVVAGMSMVHKHMSKKLAKITE